MLQHFPGYVQGEIIGVHHTFDKTEVIREQVRAFVHDQHTAGIEFQSLLILLGIIVKGYPLGDIEDGLVADHALGADMNMAQGLIKTIPLFSVKIVVVLFFQLVSVLFPDGNHAVDNLFLDDLFILILTALFELALRQFHLDRIANKVRVFLYNSLEPMHIQELFIILIFAAFLNLKNYIGSQCISLNRFYGIPLGPLGLPLVGLSAAKGLAHHSYGICYHERSIEAYTKLSDDLMTILGLGELFKVQGTTLGYDSQVFLQLLLGHANARVRNYQRAVFLIDGNLNIVVVFVKLDRFIG